ncbi:MAG: dTDP-4-dehydrorhamnose 3,5-epimerase [Candidatus Dadabacteria bacterium]|nr:MAG: dTDP-4-dehydrorhamnose 3,5-epimerase [Candidatus Dadabacteria bacterium]
MQIEPLSIRGAYLVHLETHEDPRGWFARTFCAETFRAAGLESDIRQTNLSWNAHTGTLRGLHYQIEPWGEAKLITVVRGRIFDVAADIRRDSPTFGKIVTTELDATAPVALYLDRGLAHGFLTLQDDTLIHYSMFNTYHPEAARGVRWDDPVLAIPWPGKPSSISERDQKWPTLEQLNEH